MVYWDREPVCGSHALSNGVERCICSDRSSGAFVGRGPFRSREQSMTRRVAAGVVLCAMAIAACSGTAEADPTTTPAIDSPAEVADTFMAARDDRDLETAQSYLDKEVVVDWGPGRTYDTISLGWAWEDAFRLTHTTESCETADASGETTTVVCRINVDSEVATAAGRSPGHVCASIEIVDQLITHLTVYAAEGCGYIYWANIFTPFGTWLKTAHPDTTVEAMYDDRISQAGLELWTRYTQEFLDDHS
jgi:hypothetical protein